MPGDLASLVKYTTALSGSRKDAVVKPVKLKTFEFVVDEQTGFLRPIDQAGVKRFPRWKELGLTVRKAGKAGVRATPSGRRYFATDVHFKQRSSLKTLPATGSNEAEASEECDEDDEWDCIYLDSSLNRFRKIEPAVQQLNQLRGIDLSTNLFTSVSGVQALTHLQVLNLSNNLVTDISGLNHCPTLVQLDLSYNAIEDLNADFSKLPRLLLLRLNGNKISDLGPLHRLPAVQFLELQDNQLRDIGGLGDLLVLTRLDLAQNQLSDTPAVCTALRRLPNLMSLIIRGNPIASQPGYRYEIFDAGDNLKTLDLVRITNSIRRSIDEAKRQRSMEELTTTITNEYQARIEEQRQRMETQNTRLRARQAALQEDFNRVRDKLQSELEDCIYYIEHLRHAMAKNSNSIDEGAKPLVTVINEEVKKRKAKKKHSPSAGSGAKSPVAEEDEDQEPSLFGVVQQIAEDNRAADDEGGHRRKGDKKIKSPKAGHSLPSKASSPKGSFAAAQVVAKKRSGSSSPSSHRPASSKAKASSPSSQGRGSTSADGSISPTPSRISKSSSSQSPQRSPSVSRGGSRTSFATPSSRSSSSAAAGSSVSSPRSRANDNGSSAGQARESGSDTPKKKQKSKTPETMPGEGDNKKKGKKSKSPSSRSASAAGGDSLKTAGSEEPHSKGYSMFKALGYIARLGSG